MLYMMVLKATATVGPTQSPRTSIPISNAHTYEIGMPRAKYAMPVMMAPRVYLPEARMTDMAIA